MSLLFKYFYDGDVDKFRALLAPAGHNAHNASRGYSTGGAGGGSGSTGAFATSPKAVTKSRKTSGWGAGFGGGKHGASTLGKNEVNARDHMGLTVLLRAASSTADNAIDFIEALLDHPGIDLYVQDLDSGWNCLHRALYVGNISIARLLLDKERRNHSGETIGASVTKVGHLIKTKDHEGNSPFDLFNSTIGERELDQLEHWDSSDDEGEMPHSSRDQSVLFPCYRCLRSYMWVYADALAVRIEAVTTLPFRVSRSMLAAMSSSPLGATRTFPWALAIKTIGTSPNVSCSSGLITS
jgi:hypothetical protein